jgi:hypothetical protein
MARPFVVTCPKCNKIFYASYNDFRNKPVKMLCPYCSHRFHDKESPYIDDRWKN